MTLPKINNMIYTKPFIIAEIGAVHAGSLDRAKYLIELAAQSGVDCIKFQKRNPIECVPLRFQNQPHPNPKFAYGNTYLEHRKNLELSIQQHFELKVCCENNGVDYSSSIWDLTSAKEIIDLHPKLIKIPSACNTNWDILNYIYNNFNGQIHLSLGMTSKYERSSIKNFLAENNRFQKTIVYHCTSIYPCPPERLFLNEIFSLTFYFEKVGFSNHNPEICTDIAAYALGATYFEHHFVDDKNFRHTDAAASLIQKEFIELKRSLMLINQALNDKPEGILPEEAIERNKLRAK